MIYDTLNHISAYRGLSANMDRAIDAILATDFAALPSERFEVDGDNVFFFIHSCNNPTRSILPLRLCGNSAKQT